MFLKSISSNDRVCGGLQPSFQVKSSTPACHLEIKTGSYTSDVVLYETSSCRYIINT